MGKRVWCYADGVAVLPIFAFFCGFCGKIGLRHFGAKGRDLWPHLPDRVGQKSIVMNLNSDQRKQLFLPFLTG